jgi:type IV fimbrial biogenesis protein FimT
VLGRRKASGFSLIELLIVLAVAGVLVALGFPIMGKWLKNSQVRSAAETLQNGLRYAQTQAVTQNLQTALVLTNNPGGGATSTAAVNPASSWYSTTVTSINGVANLNAAANPATGLQTGSLGNIAAGISIAGTAAAVCFNSFGRLTANTTPGPTNAACTLPTTPAANPVFTYSITQTGSDRPLRVILGLNGQVRMCDPSKTLSSTNPDGC